jgi:glucose/arabinose dehydrogenase
MGGSAAPEADATPEAASAGKRLVRLFEGLRFERPVAIAAPDSQTPRLFVAERSGRIHVVENGKASVYLDLRPLVEAGHDDGLLGLAFHPHFDRTGTLFVHYLASSPKRTVVSRFRLDYTKEPPLLDPTPEVLLEVPQPFDGQKGGPLAFGPDGFLYVATGDGGGLGDPFGYAQDRKSLLGKLLRLDADAAGMTTSYAIPLGNPYLGDRHGAREELFATGFRDPKALCFDPTQGALWALDLGQDRVSELDAVERGGNFGWNRLEGDRCREGQDCRAFKSITPSAMFDRTQATRPIGAQFYTGKRLPALSGALVVADGPTGRLWALRTQGGTIKETRPLPPAGVALSALGLDGAGELVLAGADGALYRLP